MKKTPSSAQAVDMTSPTIEVKPCSFEAAKYAVMKWHYSRAMPSSRLVKFGVWENGKFIGAVVYGRGANNNLGRPFGLTQLEICELVRVALDKHETPVSQIVAETLKLLKQSSPGLQLVISYADPAQGHKGGIYKAGNWFFIGFTGAREYFLLKGKKTHPKTVHNYGTQNLQWLRDNVDPNASIVKTPPKLKFIYPLDKKSRRKFAKLAQPYPNAIEGLEESHLDSVKEVQVQSLPIAPKKTKASK